MGATNFFAVIPGRAAGESPEPMTTTVSEEAALAKLALAMMVFIGSGLGPVGRPGMTEGAP